MMSDLAYRPLSAVVAGQAGHELTVAVEATMRRDPYVGELRVVTDRLEDLDADVLVVAGHRHLIRPEVYGRARLGAVGLHPALLPRYRGSYPLWWALWNREREAGITLYRLGPGIDDGPVIAQARVPVHAGDTFAELYERVCREIPELLVSLLEYAVDEGRLPDGVPQDEAAANVVRTPPRWKRAVLRARQAAIGGSFVVPLVAIGPSAMALSLTIGPAMRHSLPGWVPAAAAVVLVGSLASATAMVTRQR